MNERHCESGSAVARCQELSELLRHLRGGLSGLHLHAQRPSLLLCRRLEPATVAQHAAVLRGRQSKALREPPGLEFRSKVEHHEDEVGSEEAPDQLTGPGRVHCLRNHKVSPAAKPLSLLQHIRTELAVEVFPHLKVDGVTLRRLHEALLERAFTHLVPGIEGCSDALRSHGLTVAGTVRGSVRVWVEVEQVAVSFIVHKVASVAQALGERGLARTRCTADPHEGAVTGQLWCVARVHSSWFSKVARPEYPGRTEMKLSNNFRRFDFRARSGVSQVSWELSRGAITARSLL
mmetsp:Transcript_12150/g.25014  ORF Transcript_12150/g.25014 Transcript_12150/m.25014 type:complete len:291 (-) Transcript_12150:3-875(-)